jgi:hypothetical protein
MFLYKNRSVLNLLFIVHSNIKCSSSSILLQALQSLSILGILQYPPFSISRLWFLSIFDKTSNCKNLKEVKSLKPFIKRELKNKYAKIKSKVLMKIVKCSKRILFIIYIKNALVQSYIFDKCKLYVKFPGKLVTCISYENYVYRTKSN